MKLSVSQFISLDGVVQAPGGVDEDTDGGFRHGGWSMPYFDPEVMGAVIGGAMADTEALLQGRRTWSVMAGAWPEREDGEEPDPFAARMNSIQKYVVSDTLTDEDAAAWGPTTVIRGTELVARIDELRATEGGTLSVMGSSKLTKALLADDLVDELLLMVEPIVLGGGKGIFPEDGAARPWTLLDATTAGTGVQILRYERDRAAS
jgi:dihydrofolate reductase